MGELWKNIAKRIIPKNNNKRIQTLFVLFALMSLAYGEAVVRALIYYSYVNKSRLAKWYHPDDH